MEKLKVYKKLLELQKELSFVEKDASGKNYKYASGDAILSKARPKMDSLGLLLLQEIVSYSHENVLWKTSNGDKQQTFASVNFRFTWVDTESGETIEQLFASDGFNDWDKAIGSAMTYAERYFFMKQFHIPTDELDPNQREEKPQEKKWEKKQEAPKAYEQKKQEPMVLSGMATPMQIGKIFSLGTAMGIKDAGIHDLALEKFKVKSLKDLTKQDASIFIDYLMTEVAK